MNVFSIFVGVVLAAEGIISPIPDELPRASLVTTKPDVTFGQLPVPEVLGVVSEEPLPSFPITRKSSYTIAVLGDSMVDTLGPGVPHLKSALKSVFPRTSFTIYNYGVGGTNIDYGLARLTSDYLYLDTLQQKTELAEFAMVEFMFTPETARSLLWFLIKGYLPGFCRFYRAWRRWKFWWETWWYKHGMRNEKK